MTHRRLWIASLLLATSGCATYYLPVGRLETPESCGNREFGRFEAVGIQMGSNLTSPPLYLAPPAGSTSAPTPVLQRSWLDYFFGMTVGVAEHADVGFRFQPYAPFDLRFKYQVYGQPESVAEAGNFSVSLTADGGLMLGAGTPGNGVSYYTASGGVIGGYRFALRHLVSASPFFGLAGLSAASAAPQSGSQYGLALGYQYRNQALFTRFEVSYVAGSVGTPQIFGFFGGMSMGLIF